MKKKIYISLFQINKQDYKKNLREILYSLKTTLSKDYKVIISNKIIPNQNNILIESFNKKDARYILNIKKTYPKTKLFCVITEYLDEKAFNSDVSFFQNLIFNFYNLILLNIFDKLPFNPKRIFYFWLRKKNFIEVVKYFDALISIHKKINKNYLTFKKEIITFFPIIPKKNYALNTNKKFVICGQISKPRVIFYNKIKNVAKNLNIKHNYFYNYKIEEFNFNFKQHGIFAIDIPKTNKWKFSSCTRYLSSLSHGRIPIIQRKYNDHETEELCYILNKINKETLLKLLDQKEIIFLKCKKKLAIYLKLAEKNNFFFLKKFKKCLN